MELKRERERSLEIMLDEENRKGAVFRVVRQMIGTNRDVVGIGYEKDANGKIDVDDNRVLNVWKEHYDKISNVEFPCSRDSLTEVDAVSGPSELISTNEVRKAIAKMKSNREDSKILEGELDVEYLQRQG